MEWKPLQKPRPIAHLVSRRRLREFLALKQPTRADFVDTACWIISEFFRGRTFADNLQAFLNVAFSIDQAKIQVVGQNGSTLASNMLIQFVGSIWIVGTHIEDDGPTELIDSLLALTKDDEWGRWFYPKLNHVNRILVSKINIAIFAFDAQLTDKERERFDALEASLGKSLSQITDEMVMALHEHRAYGIKPCFFRDGVFHKKEDAWLFTDVDELRDPEFDIFGLRSDAFAWIQLTSLETLKSAEVTRHEVVIDAEQGIRTYGVGVDAMSTLDFILNRSGSLTFGEVGAFSVRDLFRVMGREREFDVLRYSLVLQLFDLVVPVKIVRGLPSLPVHRPRRPTEPSALEDLFNPKLVLPRIKILGNQPDLVRALDEEATEEEEGLKRRSPRRHECSGGRRELPPGKHASPEARARAAAAGIELKENQTFVKKHKRGKGALVIPRHEAVRRQVPGT
jgi:hypothetical protein